MSKSSSFNAQALDRLEETSARYREAFLEVQQLIARSELGSVPSWTFAIDRLPLDKVAELSAELARAERRRRAWRAALFALTELFALDGAPEGSAPSTSDDTPEQMGQLDRFITVVNGARDGGCIYVDGRFEPILPSGSPSNPPAPSPVAVALESAEE